jgi:glycosyltransferase involved in cell wall biosynthesis
VNGVVMKLSACVMVKDSLRTLPACLDSLAPFCDELVVVDDFSTDGTWEYLQQRGGKLSLHRRKLDTFASHRRAMCALAQGEWVLIVDADEAALPGLGEEVRRLIDSNPTQDAFAVPQKNVLPSHWPKTVWFWTAQKRLFRKGAGSWADSNWVHVPLVHPGRAGRLEHGLLHHSYDSVTHLLRKQVAYARSGAEHLHARGRRSGLALTVVKTTAAFFKYFIVKGLFRFGMGGLVVASSLAFYDFAKYALLWELNSGRPEGERAAVPGEVPTRLPREQGSEADPHRGS